jgi:hypothetical protein
MARPKIEQPDTVCKPCGEKWGRYVLDRAAKWTQGTCDICEKETKVTSPWNYAGMKQDWNKQ